MPALRRRRTACGSPCCGPASSGAASARWVDGVGIRVGSTLIVNGPLAAAAAHPRGELRRVRRALRRRRRPRTAQTLNVIDSDEIRAWAYARRARAGSQHGILATDRAALSPGSPRRVERQRARARAARPGRAAAGHPDARALPRTLPLAALPEPEGRAPARLEAAGSVRATCRGCRERARSHRVPDRAVPERRLDLHPGRDPGAPAARLRGVHVLRARAAARPARQRIRCAAEHARTTYPLRRPQAASAGGGTLGAGDAPAPLARRARPDLGRPSRRVWLAASKASRTCSRRACSRGRWRAAASSTSTTTSPRRRPPSRWRPPSSAASATASRSTARGSSSTRVPGASARRSSAPPSPSASAISVAASACCSRRGVRGSASTSSARACSRSSSPDRRRPCPRRRACSSSGASRRRRASRC